MVGIPMQKTSTSNRPWFSILRMTHPSCRRRSLDRFYLSRYTRISMMLLNSSMIILSHLPFTTSVSLTTLTQTSWEMRHPQAPTSQMSASLKQSLTIKASVVLVIVARVGMVASRATATSAIVKVRWLSSPSPKYWEIWFCHLIQMGKPRWSRECSATRACTISQMCNLQQGLWVSQWLQWWYGISLCEKRIY